MLKTFHYEISGTFCGRFIHCQSSIVWNFFFCDIKLINGVNECMQWQNLIWFKIWLWRLLCCFSYYLLFNSQSVADTSLDHLWMLHSIPSSKLCHNNTGDVKRTPEALPFCKLWHGWYPDSPGNCRCQRWIAIRRQWINHTVDLNFFLLSCIESLPANLLHLQELFFFTITNIS